MQSRPGLCRGLLRSPALEDFDVAVDRRHGGEGEAADAWEWMSAHRFLGEGVRQWPATCLASAAKLPGPVRLALAILASQGIIGLCAEGEKSSHIKST